MDSKMRDEVIIRLLKDTVESEGCLLAEVDLKGLKLRVDGPDQNVEDCARAVADIFD
ncbi:MAG: hypothetical protein PVF37_03930 [Desulfobacterales bacterium]|jgi:hypothetical protein